MVPTLLNRRLIFVMGKGGVGKSTIALALGLAAARTGRRAVVAELANGDGLQRRFEQPGGRHFEEVRLAPNLFTISIDAQAAMEEYLVVKVPSPLAALLGPRRLFGAFAMATPGMRELLQIGKVWELAQPERRTREADPYDVVIVDSPATGHGIGVLRSPRTFAEIAKVGPIAHQGETIARTIADRDFTAFLGVTTAEEMPVNEILALRQELIVDQLDFDVVVANELYPHRFDSDAIARLTAARAAVATNQLSAAIDVALSESARADTQTLQYERLEEFGDRLVNLPFLFKDDTGPEQIARLADLLAESVR